MRTTIVPAQITTVEDKVAGNLSFTQLLLLVTPVFLSGAVYAFLPKFMEFSFYKGFIVGIITLICLTLAVRIKGRLLLEWIVIRSRYNRRPQVYVHGINSAYLRDTAVENADPSTESEAREVTPSIQYEKPKMPRLIRLEEALSSPESDFHFAKNKKGGMSVRIKEI